MNERSFSGELIFAHVTVRAYWKAGQKPPSSYVFVKETSSGFSCCLVAIKKPSYFGDQRPQDCRPGQVRGGPAARDPGHEKRMWVRRKWSVAWGYFRAP